MHKYPSPGARRRLTLNPPGLFAFELVRLLDHELTLLGPRLHVLERDLNRRYYSRINYRQHALAMTLVGAERIFGRSSTHFDPYKGSFYFPLWLSALRNGIKLRYFLDLRDTRGAMDMELARFQPDPVSREDMPLPPIESELSSDEVELLIETVLDFIRMSGELLIPSSPPLYRAIQSEFTLYGCQFGKPFEQTLESNDDFEDAELALTKALGESMREETQKDLETLLGDLERTELRSP